MKSKNCLKQIGVTEGGTPILAGVYREYETSGLPLDVLLPMLSDIPAIPCWISLYREAKQNGMAHKRILSMLQYPIIDAYGSAVKDRVFSTLDRLFESNNPCLDISSEWGPK